MAKLIPADIKLPPREINPENGEDFKLAELYRALDCTNIETLRLESGKLMILDGEGKGFKDRNERATEMVGFVSPKELVQFLFEQRARGFDVFHVGQLDDTSEEADYIAGDVVVCEMNEFR